MLYCGSEQLQISGLFKNEFYFALMLHAGCGSTPDERKSTTLLQAFSSKTQFILSSFDVLSTMFAHISLAEAHHMSNYKPIRSGQSAPIGKKGGNI